MKPKRLHSRRFTLSDQSWFGALSGDVNPLHVDPVGARRLLFGDVVVHGIHGALWMLERHLATRPGSPGRIVSLKAQFLQPAFLDQEVTVSRTAEAEGEATLAMTAGAAVLITLHVKTEPGTAIQGPPPRGASASGSPRDLKFADVSNPTNPVGGRISLTLDEASAAKAFPSLMAVVGPETLSALLALTRLVGMECPGLHSLFAGFSVDLHPEAGSPAAPGPAALVYRVERAAAPFAPIQMSVAAPGLRGVVNAFFRPGSVAQPGMAAVALRVTAGEFAAERALVVGGSRGLGEVTAKIIAAGGGHPIITYWTGEADARRVQAEIVAAGGPCDTVRFDVLRPAAAFAHLRRLRISPTQLYFFATPRITRTKQAPFEPDRLRQFISFYVDGFYEVCTLASRLQPGLKVFYPSTVFVEEGTRDNPEYMVAKAAGEALCAHLGRFGAPFSVICHRLPKIATDQTASLLRGPSVDALDAMLPLVRRMTAGPLPRD